MVLQGIFLFLMAEVGEECRPVRLVLVLVGRGDDRVQVFFRCLSVIGRIEL